MMRIHLLIVALLLSLASCSGKDHSSFDDFIVEPPAFSIAIIPDIQYYTMEPDNMMLNQMVDYIISPSNGLNIIHSLQVGDLTENNSEEEWENALSFYERITSGTGLSFCLGNHDYRWETAKRRSLMKQYINTIDQNIVRATLDGTLENSFSVINYGELEIGIISLEYAPRNEAVFWAEEIIQANPEMLFILLTHAYLNRYGDIYDHLDTSQPDSPYDSFSDTSDLNDGEEIWQKLVYNNRNVRFVICGHATPSSGCVCKLKENKYGDTVAQILVNYQHYKGGGEGYFGVLAIDPPAEEIRLRVYSPYLDKGKSDVKYDFKLEGAFK